MTGFSAQQHAHHAARVQGLYEHARWLERDCTTPVSEYLAHIVPVDSAQMLADYAAARGMDGPHPASDGSWFLYRTFAGGVTWQAVCYGSRTGMSRDEQKARAWADTRGLIITARVDTAGSPS